MIRLHRIEAEDFKSYKGHQVLGPFKEFTAVIGPNGAGKSNLMDAISFVLGVRAQNLRGNQLKDLIHGANSGKNLKKGSVSAVFIDPEGKEVVLKRTVSSSGSSEYKINGKTCTWDEYNSKLKGYGINIKTRNFLVFQGDVESIAQKNPKELTSLFEEISGSGELKAAYEESMAEKEKAEQTTLLNFQEKKRINAEKKQFREQKEEAERFEKLIKKKNDTKEQHTLFQLYQYDKERQAISSEKNKLEAELKRQEPLIEKYGDQIESKKKEQAEVKKGISSVEKESGSLEKNLNKQRPKCIKTQEQIKHARSRLEQSKKNFKKAEATHANHSEEITALERELEEIVNVAKDYEAYILKQSEEQEEDMSLQEDLLEEYNALREEATRKTVNMRKEIEKIKREQTTSKAEIERLNGKKDELTERKEHLIESGKQLEQRKEKLEVYVNSNIQTVNKLKNELVVLSKTVKEAAERHRNITQKLEMCQSQLREAKADRMENERDAKMNDCLANLKRLFPGVHGKLHDLCKISNPKKYQVAISVALGKNIDAIVVDNAKTGMECIRYMKEQHAGTATFIPLESIEAKQANERLRHLGHDSKLAIDLLQFEQSISRAILYACGDTIVCDNLDIARKLCFSGNERVKAVTLDGTVIRKSGIITGGLNDIQSKNSKWDEKKVQKLKSDRENFLKDLNELSKKKKKDGDEQQLQSQISGLENRLKYANVDLKLTIEKFEKNENEIASTTKEMEKIEPALAKFTKSEKSFDASILKVQSRMDVLERNIFDQFCSKINVDNIAEFESKNLKKSQDIAKRRLELANQQSRLKNQLEYERSRNTEGPVKKLKASIAADKDALETLTAEEKAYIKVIEDNEERLSSLRKQKNELKVSGDEKEVEIQEIKKLRNAKLKEKLNLEKLKDAKITALINIRQKKHEQLKVCKLEDIRISFARGSLDDVEEGVGFSNEEDASRPSGEEDAMDVDEAANSQTFPPEDTIEPNYDSLPRKLREIKSKDDVERILEEFVEEVKSINSEIEKISPNMKANDKLEDVKNKLKASEDEFEHARQNAKGATDLFNKIKARRYELFNAAFTHISARIDQVYKELTKNPLQPLGGTAYLSLENSEEPYLHGVKYNAMPPMKRFRDMDQLSGGEKTVAALALLFAIHSYQPAPFFVMDEIDAALDNANVNKVSNYIRLCSGRKDFQCIVISLKDTFFEKAESLVGVYRDQNKDCSGCLTVDLTQYEEGPLK
eukprot:Nk52_evm64s152 gene=Nk52_evmTU64s152